MAARDKLLHIVAELRGHAPFTVFGALLGIVFMAVFRGLARPSPEVLFGIFHPAHVMLSAMVTSSLFAIHRKGKNFLLVLVVGYVGSIGIATLSDSVVPYIGASLFGLHVPTHADLHGAEDTHTGESDDEHAGHAHEAETANEHAGHAHETGHPDETEHHLHLGFLEDWYVVHPAAILGVLIAWSLPRTKFPHAAHVLISTWASSAHMLMNLSGAITAASAGAMFLILFIAVWLPCCISDIIFPLLFVKSDLSLTDVCICTHHERHSHEHIHKHTDECGGKEDE